MSREILNIPAHIERAGVRGAAIDFEWVSADQIDYYDRESKQLLDRVRVLSPRAQLALSAGIAEWIVWRFDAMAEFDDLRDFIEAVWAGVIDYRYLVEWTRPRDRDLRGPILEPQWVTARLLDRVFLTGRRRVTTSMETMYLAFLAFHVLPKQSAYKSWIDQVTARLAELSPRTEQVNEYFKTLRHTEAERAAFDWGVPVARMAMDTSMEYDASASAEQLDTYLRQLDPSTNRFLVDAKQLLDEGFDGQPYRFPAQLP